MMFSATFPKPARDLAKEHLKHDHIRIRVGRAGSSHISIKQDVIFVEPAAERQAILDLSMAAPPPDASKLNPILTSNVPKYYPESLPY
jgi:ATP-dependent RNA helicase DDX3X